MTTKGYRLQIGDKNPPFGVGPYQVNYNNGIKSIIVNKIAVVQDKYPEIYHYPYPENDFESMPQRSEYYMFTSLEVLKNIFGGALYEFLELGFEVYQYDLEVDPHMVSFSGLQLVAGKNNVTKKTIIKL